MIWLLCLFLFFPSLNSNISWIFPFPRWPSLDGINSRDYHYPCGINKNNKSHKYTFVLHRPYVLRWKTTGNHNKGYRINLYDSSNHSIQIHPSSKSQEQSFNSNINSVTISFKHPCDDCFMQIEESTTSGPTYFSCADIDIRDKEVTASNVTGELCKETQFEGDYCQLKGKRVLGMGIQSYNFAFVINKTFNNVILFSLIVMMTVIV
uniref:Uncharacterized protein n=1 Tax=Bursaphelenchus xylophilus TaxID=6326 RepID=A0A1I7SMF8_BURXY